MEEVRPHETGVHEMAERRKPRIEPVTRRKGRKGPTITSSGSRPTGRMPPSSFLALNALGERLAEGGNKTFRQH
jgi:hypothetical protein